MTDDRHASESSISARGHTFVLVHGSWHGGWCWKRTAERLRRDGHAVYAPTLTGLADRAHLISDAVDLETHIADIAGLILYEELEAITLCGHSFGGMVATSVADRLPERITALVLLDAFVPDDGQSLCDVAGLPQPVTPVQTPPPAAGLCRDPSLWPWLERKMTPHPNGTRTQKARLTGRLETIARKTYVRAPAFAFPVFDRLAATLAARPGWTVTALAGVGHDVMLDDPERLAALLDAEATAGGVPR